MMLFISCDKEHFVFNETKSLPAKGWGYKDRVGFQVPLVDTNYIYNLFLEIDNERDFPYQNAYVRIFTKFPTGDTLTQPLSLNFFDLEGKPNGTCKKETCTTIVNLQDSVYFSELGNYYFGFEQYSRDSIIKGLNSITLKLQKTDIEITPADKE